METHCFNMELKYQNQVLKNGQHGQILNETSNEANIKREINALETRNIDLESSVARLLIENEKLNKENEHLTQTYKDLFDSIKKTSVQTKDHADSLIVQLNCLTVKNPDLKAQIQEKVFANAALKNKLRKSTRNIFKTINLDETSFTTTQKPIRFTPYYLPKVRESAPVKLHHVNAPRSSRNSKKESYGSNDMAHNYSLEKAKKKTQDKSRNLKSREMTYTKTHHTPNAYTPKPRSNNQTSRNWPASKSCEEMLKAGQKTDHSRNPSLFSDFNHFVCSTCQKCVFNTNHDVCITKFLKEVNSRAKIQPNKTRNSNKTVDPTSHTQKPGRKIVTGHSFSHNKSSAVHEKTNTPRSCLRGKLRQHQHRHHQPHKLKLHMYLNLFHNQSLKQRLLLLGKKVEAIPKSAWTQKRSDWQLLERKKVNEELRKVYWWEIVRGRLSAITKDHMIYHMLSSS
nr:hypothetical protein [Tanacetum cinerariifolium]